MLLITVNDNTNGIYTLFLIYVFIFMFILNFKGHVDIIQYVALFIFIPKFNDNGFT